MVGLGEDSKFASARASVFTRIHAPLINRAYPKCRVILSHPLFSFQRDSNAIRRERIANGG